MSDESIPKSWASIKLAEVGTWRGGGTPSKANPAFWTDGTIPWVSPKDMKQPQLSTAQDLITESAVESSATNLIAAGSVLLVTRSGILAHSLPVAVNLVPVALNQDIKAVTPHEIIDAEYLRLIFQCFERDILNTCRKGGTTVHSIEFPALQDFSIPLPPLAEQKRIVAKIEELFSELEAGEESLRVARRQLGVYRQSLLKQAFEGKLTRCRKVELTPLRDLITGLSQGWSPKCELNRAPRFDEWAIIKTTAIQHCHYDDSEAKPLPPPFEPRPSIEIKDGDFLMTRKGPRARAGVSCYVRKTRPLLMVCDTVYRFRCIEEKVHPLYLELALNSPDVLRAIDRQKAGISESGLSLTHTKIGTVEIPLCSLPEQQEIVRLLDEQFEVIDRNERELDVALERSAALRQAILKRAFTGRLVPQDPSDEPAATLLARLRAERETLSQHRSVRAV